MAKIKVDRPITDIDIAVNALDASVKKVNADLKKTEAYLQYNPTSVEAISRKYEQMAAVVEKSRERLAALNAQYDDIKKTQDDSGKINETNQKALEKNRKEVDELTKSINRYEAALNSSQRKQEEGIAKNKNWEKSLSSAEAVAKKFSRTALVVVGALTALVTKSIQSANEIYDTARKLNTSAEELQKGRYVYEQLAGGADEYDAALTALSNTMALIARGSGARYTRTLRQLGLTTKELQGKSTSEQLIIITEALSKVEDEATRTNQAIALLGQAGRQVAVIAGESAQSIDYYTQELEKAGLISNEAAQANDELQKKLDATKQQLSAAGAEIAINLAPIVLELIDAIAGLVKWFSELDPAFQKIIVGLLVVIVILPKVIALIKGIVTVVGFVRGASLTAAPAVGGLGAAASPLIPIFIAIALALTVVIGLLSIFSKRAREASKSATALTSKLSGLDTEYNDISADLGYTTESVSQSSSTSTTNINVDIYGHGDTEISDDAAVNLAVLTADEVNKRLGALIK